MDYEESFFARKYYAPTDVVSGYQVRPGFYLRNGASVVEGGSTFIWCDCMQPVPVSSNGGRTFCSDSVPGILSDR